MKKFLGLLLLFPIFVLHPLSAQISIKGKIVDSKTGEPLSAAHVIIKGTYTGTIANVDGEYSLNVKSFPSTIIVQFLGYESQEKTIEEGFEGRLDFEMTESFLELQEIQVTGEDPAISIMKEVIRKKQIWREKLNTYKVDAYTRQQILKDTAIVSITESISEAFWDKKRGSREVLKSKRQTANIEGSDNFAGVSYLPNFYDDNLDIVEFDVVGVTHPDALKFYNFKLVDFTKLDDNIVFEIEVKSRKKLQPLFEGTIYVLDIEYAMISVKLKPNSVIVFPPPIQNFNMYYEQQFSNFGGDYWLPVDFRMEGMIEIGVPGLRFPPIGFSQISKLNEYKVNSELPDSLYKDFSWITVDSTTIEKSDSLFMSSIDVVPLSEKEEAAYGSLDRNTSLEKEFRPTGFLARFIDFDDDEDDESESSREEVTETDSTGATTKVYKRKEPTAFSKFLGNLSPQGRYNRVDAVYLGVKHERRYVDRRVRSRLNIGYSTGYEELNHGGDISWWPLKKSRRFVLNFGYKFSTEERYSSDFYPEVFTSLNPLFGFNDYFDYYRKEGVYLAAAFRPRRNPNTFRFRYRLENHSSIDYKTSYDISGRDNNQRLNPPINDGTLSSVSLELVQGEGKEALGIIGADDIRLSVEQSSKMIGSDWDFTRFEIDMYRHYETFFKRRFIPNSLELRLNAGTYLGDLPVQKNGVLDVALGRFTPFGAFKSKRFIPYEGSSFAALHAEHNFRSIPFEMLGWRKSAKSGISLIAFGSIGRTWVSSEQRQFFSSTIGYVPSNAKEWHSEVGASISNIFSLFRVDLAYRIDEPGFYPSISVARLF